MMKKIHTSETKLYDGELRKQGDDREAQLLKDYDAVFKTLLDKGLEHGLELPPLFEKDFIDHGALTSQNKNTEDIRANINVFLQFLDRSNLFDILVPSSRDSKGKGGYKVDGNDPRIPPDIRLALNKCTETFITTVRQKAVRLRFLDAQKLEKAVAKKIEEKVAALRNRYEIWVEKAVDKFAKDVQTLRKQFRDSFTGLGDER